MIYLDNAATTYPKPECIYKYLDQLNREYSFNAGRGMYQVAQNVSAMIEETRNAFTKLVNAYSTIFSSSATFALNQIINGLPFDQYANVYYSPYEHNAVMRTLHKRKKEIGFKLIEIPLDEEYGIDLEKLNYMFSKDQPSAVFCTHVSNVTGYILPIERLGKMIYDYKGVYIVDAAQSFGILPLDMKRDNIDYIIFAGHKSLYGPFGVGGFCYSNKISLNEYFVGGTGSDSLNLEMPCKVPDKYEPSSHNAPAIISLNRSLQWIFDNQILIEKEKNTYQYLIENLKGLKELDLYCSDKNSYFGIASFNIHGYTSEDVCYLLDTDYNISVRAGYHCAPNIHKYLDVSEYLGCVRVSLSLFTTKEDVEFLLKAVKEIIAD